MVPWPHRLLSLALLLGLFAVMQALAGPSAKAQDSVWYPFTSATSDDGGAWRLSETADQDLIGAGYTAVRVTSAACDTPIAQAMVFDVELQPTEAGDSSWGGILKSVGGISPATPLAPNTGDVHFVPVPAGTEITAALDGLPPDLIFTVCLGQGQGPTSIAAPPVPPAVD